jgi:RNA polymerase-binding transcription factor DksA
MASRKEKPGASKKSTDSDAAAASDAGTAATSGTSAAKDRTAWLRALPKNPLTKPDLKRYRGILLQMREKILRSSRNLADEALKASGQDFSVDHMADHGTDNFDQDFSLALLEGETELMRDVESAISKIDGKEELPFGLCEGCADDAESDGPAAAPNPWIPKGRLDVLPYARLCVVHQEREEGGGGAG